METSTPIYTTVAVVQTSFFLRFPQLLFILSLSYVILVV